MGALCAQYTQQHKQKTPPIPHKTTNGSNHGYTNIETPFNERKSKENIKDKEKILKTPTPIIKIFKRYSFFGSLTFRFFATFHSITLLYSEKRGV